jgi:hypothetical protein
MMQDALSKVAGGAGNEKMGHGFLFQMVSK